MKTAIAEVTIVKTMKIKYSKKSALAEAVEVLANQDMLYGGSSFGNHGMFSVEPIETKAYAEVIT